MIYDEDPLRRSRRNRQQVKTTGGVCLNGGKLGKMAFQTRARSPKSGRRMAAEGMQFSWRWNDGTMSPNLGVIWEMSGKQAAHEIAEVSNTHIGHRRPSIPLGLRRTRPLAI